MNTYERLQENLTYLKLNKIKEIIDKYLEQAIKENITIVEIINYLMEEQKQFKQETALQMSTQVAGFPFRKTIEQYDFTFQPCIDMEVINELRTMRFIYNNENVIFLGAPGVGKTHLAIGLGMEAIRNRLSVYYINCYTLLSSLNKAQYENKLKEKLKTLSKYKLLIIDEVGYLPFDKQGANLFFQLISMKYEKSSVIITSNRTFGEWDQILTDKIIASAVLDRLLHHSTIINIKGQSYRLKDRKKILNFIEKDSLNK